MNLFEIEENQPPPSSAKHEISFQVIISDPALLQEQIKLLCGSPIDATNTAKVTINYKYDVSAICSLTQSDVALVKIKNIIDIVNSDATTINNVDLNGFDSTQEAMDDSIRKLLIFSDLLQKLTIAIQQKTNK